MPANEDSYIANKLNCGIENELGCEQAIAGMTRSYRALRWARAVRAGVCEGRGLFRAEVCDGCGLFRAEICCCRSGPCPRMRIAT